MSPDETTAVAPRPSRRGVPALVAATAAAVVLFDQLTKHWAVNALSNGRTIDVFWTLRWNLSFNEGMAFSTGAGFGAVIGVIALIVTAVVVSWSRGQHAFLPRLAAGLIAGGALGNVVDRLFRDDAWMRGAVVDFVDFQWFPIFNVADAAVNVGGALFILWAWFGGRRARTDQDRPC